MFDIDIRAIFDFLIIYSNIRILVTFGFGLLTALFVKNIKIFKSNKHGLI